ncbi:hypothetical protein QO001_003338 [Methylobacterium brachiatum]|jgi:hypothetical protein|uniref:Uncharacterized protein n=1 Tax=Methylobacterium brachiatum TaxID=269660 RepID=A0AAJ1TT09_9HYPH|nr:hypothetical protein [Methylobacterium brachiatum]MCB4801393.1 hypothetical protein [Methylobacterium brachiatum]MDQ0544404.1 hypothetical protein [Methylobacterium brachiatum]
MATIRHAVILGVLLGAAPALAQSSANPDGARVGRRITATGQTKPPSPAVTGTSRPVNEVAMIKAQKAAEARSKAWDSKMRHTMGTICNGC